MNKVTKVTGDGTLARVANLNKVTKVTGGGLSVKGRSPHRDFEAAERRSHHAGTMT
jgi:hypothetical protein